MKKNVNTWNSIARKTIIPSATIFIVIIIWSCSTTTREMSTEKVALQPVIEEMYMEDAVYDISEEAAPITSMEIIEIEEEEVAEETFNIPPKTKEFNTEAYDAIIENIFKNAKQSPLSTFSIDVDNASYSNIRRFLNNGSLPAKGSVRIEEMVNYFDYQYETPKGKHPFVLNSEYSSCPWNKDNGLLKIALQGKDIEEEDLLPSNLVFLIDVSGSMSDRNKLPLVKESLELLVNELQNDDRVAIAVYAGAAGLVLPSTAASEKDAIMNAFNSLSSGGSTAGAEGIELAYNVAQENYKENGNNRIILVTDGDFNVGASSSSELVELIEQKRDKGIYLTICGFGMGNYNDATMEKLSNAGNGNYFYIDGKEEANKVFRKNLRSNMYAIAKDVKIQIEFNPLCVASYRLIGYENRVLQNEDFNNDKKDAGELGAGHTVTALYEIVPAGVKPSSSVDALKYQTQKINDNATSKELATIKFRYKPLDSDKSILMENIITNRKQEMSQKFAFAAGVASFGMVLRDSQHKGNSSFGLIRELCKAYSFSDEYTREFITLVDKAEFLTKENN